MRTIAMSGVIKYMFLERWVTYVPRSFSRNKITAVRYIIMVMICTGIPLPLPSPLPSVPLLVEARLIKKIARVSACILQPYWINRFFRVSNKTSSLARDDRSCSYKYWNCQMIVYLSEITYDTYLVHTRTQLRCFALSKHTLSFHVTLITNPWYHL